MVGLMCLGSTENLPTISTSSSTSLVLGILSSVLTLKSTRLTASPGSSPSACSRQSERQSTNDTHSSTICTLFSRGWRAQQNLSCVQCGTNSLMTLQPMTSTLSLWLATVFFSLRKWQNPAIWVLSSTSKKSTISCRLATVGSPLTPRRKIERPVFGSMSKSLTSIKPFSSRVEAFYLFCSMKDVWHC